MTIAVPHGVLNRKNLRSSAIPPVASPRDPSKPEYSYGHRTAQYFHERTLQQGDPSTVQTDCTVAKK